MSYPPQPPPQGPTPYGQPGPYGQQSGPAPYGQQPRGPLPYGQPPGYGRPQWGQQPNRDVFIPTGPVRRPWLRPVIGLGAAMLAVGGFWVLSVVADDGNPYGKGADDARVGDCVENRGTDSDPALFTIACDDTKAAYKVLLQENREAACPSGTDSTYTRSRTYGGVTLTLCLAAVQP
ncbi:hypothetical protein P8605_09215 [Streptomyces sp. T-3]|nr:hypothetical protein [Streptomyces sp. T-3]